MSQLKTVWRLLTVGDKILAGSLIVISLFSLTILNAVSRPGETAVIHVENRQRFNKNLNQPETFTVAGFVSESTIEIRRNAIRVVGSGCPQELCVRQGSISQTGEIIVCVPNKLTIAIQGSRKNKFDAVTG